MGQEKCVTTKSKVYIHPIGKVYIHPIGIFMEKPVHMRPVVQYINEYLVLTYTTDGAPQLNLIFFANCLVNKFYLPPALSIQTFVSAELAC
jgi:hypothetical protein